MIMESIGFMDALSASAVTKKDPKKRKRLPSNSTTKKDEPESPKIDVKPLKFYKDTLEENEEEAATNGEKSPTKEAEKTSSDVNAETKEGSPVKTETSTDVKTEKSPEKEIEFPVEKRKPGIGCGPDGPPGVLVDPNMPRKKKRPIRWRADEDLTEVRFFELDENERVNVTKTFTEQKQIEHGEERSAFKLGQRLATEDTMVEQTKWRPLIPVDNTLQLDYGGKSREVLIQAEREKNVLQELYLGASFNESPKEPDHENYEHIEPQMIPLDDVTGNPDSVTNFTDIPWPTPKGELPATFSSNAFANVFSGVNIPSGIGLSSNVAISNPLAAFANPSNQIITQPWIVQQPPFMQPPPNMIPQGLPAFNNRSGINQNNNNYRSNNRPYNNSGGGGGGGNWVRGNTRRGTCNQFQRTGVCRNKSCPYIHER
jgi:protein phosphatase 1 regulatory subunit 10